MILPIVTTWIPWCQCAPSPVREAVIRPEVSSPRLSDAVSCCCVCVFVCLCVCVFVCLCVCVFVCFNLFFFFFNAKNKRSSYLKAGTGEHFNDSFIHETLCHLSCLIVPLGGGFGPVIKRLTSQLFVSACRMSQGWFQTVVIIAEL